MPTARCAHQRRVGGRLIAPSVASDSVDTVVVGAGVTGLAIGRALALRGCPVVVLEANSRIGQETSSRNSEVVHAGIYYPPASLKAALCVRGQGLLYEYARDRDVPCKRLGKLIVATSPDEHPKLLTLQRNGKRAGVSDLRLISAAECAELEPELNVHSALFSASSGIIDSHTLMERLILDIQNQGGEVVCHSPVRHGRISSSGIDLTVGDAASYTIRTRRVINAAGHGAQTLARATAGFPPSSVPQQYYARGQYYVLQGGPPFQRLVYPLPAADGLGIHATPDLGGAIKFGPDVNWVNSLDYGFDDDRRDAFVSAIRRYYPALDADRLHPGTVGVRPKLVAAGATAADFRIDGPGFHGIDGLVNLFGIESPGLTSSLAIGEHVANLLG